MRLLLIRESSSLYRYSNTSYGLGLIGSVAKEVAEVKILDNNSLHKFYSIKDILKVIKAFSPHVIGFNVHAFNIYPTQRLISAVAGSFKGICLLGGGLHTFSEPQEVGEIGVHIVVKGEAERTIKPLLCHIDAFADGDTRHFSISSELAERLRGLPGLLFRVNGSSLWEDTGPPKTLRDLDSLPFVDYDLFNLKDFLKRSCDSHFVTNVIIGQRGCPFKCPFCHIENDTSTGRIRENSASYKTAYVKFIRDKYDPEHIVFYDENFTLHRKATIDFCRQLVQNGLHEGITFSCQTNVVVPFDDELLQALKEANFSQVGLGVERLSKKSLALIRKNRTYETIIHNIDLLNRYGIGVLANCLIGFPFDTVDTIREETMLFEKNLEKIEVFSINNLLPPPGTKIYEQTRYKRWYFDPKVICWKPSLYHTIYNFSNNAWDVNYFNLDSETQNAIQRMKEHFYDITVRKMNSRLINVLHFLERGIAIVSLSVYRISPLLENILFSSPKYMREKARSFFLMKYYVKRKIGQDSQKRGLLISDEQSEPGGVVDG
ncbi:MAG: B12-binding domain-containing radical SAM protein [Thermodesulfobacteriota bacterium]|nr:B12-binding domain-containing radical SAM protein [Thermodesulfobacteriota bacterium]